jgi:putative transposase
MQIEVPPHVAVSSVVQLLKQEPGKRIIQRFGYIRKMYIENSIWAVGYFSSTIGRGGDQIRKYIRQQGEEEETPRIVSF